MILCRQGVLSGWRENIDPQWLTPVKLTIRAQEITSKYVEMRSLRIIIVNDKKNSHPEMRHNFELDHLPIRNSSRLN